MDNTKTPKISNEGTEVEAKYWAPSVDTTTYDKEKDIQQGYFDLQDLPSNVQDFFIEQFPDINLDHYKEARLRNKGGKYYLTLKSDGTLERSEAECSIAKEEFEIYWPFTTAGSVEKTRYEKPLNGLTLETDRYRGKFEGLFSSEVEFDSDQYTEADIDEMIQAEIPGAINVTRVTTLKNKQLAKIPNKEALIAALLEDKEALAALGKTRIEQLFQVEITEIPAGATRVIIHDKFVALGRHSGPRIDMQLRRDFNCYSPFSCQVPPFQFAFCLPSGDNPKEQALLDYLNKENKMFGQRVEFEFEK